MSVVVAVSASPAATSLAHGPLPGYRDPSHGCLSARETEGAGWPERPRLHFKGALHQSPRGRPGRVRRPGRRGRRDDPVAGPRRHPRAAPVAVRTRGAPKVWQYPDEGSHAVQVTVT